MSNTDTESDRPVETRTPGSERRSCRWCAGEIRGRRQKFCSDRCRMQNRRAERAARIEEWLVTIDESVRRLRRELASRRAGVHDQERGSR